MYERLVGVALLGIRPCSFAGVLAVPSGYLRPVAAKAKYQGCVVEYLQEITGKRLNLIPPKHKLYY